MSTRWLSYLLINLLVLSASSNLTSQDKDKQIEIVLDQLAGLLNQPAREGYTVLQSIDIDKDGVADAVIEYRDGRGPLSTYFRTYEFRTLGECWILRGGEPLDEGTAIKAADLLNGIKLCRLFTAGNSLRFPERPAADFSSGPWYDVDSKALVVVKRNQSALQLGTIVLSMSENRSVVVEQVNAGSADFGDHQIKFESADR